MYNGIAKHWKWIKFVMAKQKVLQKKEQQKQRRNKFISSQPLCISTAVIAEDKVNKESMRKTEREIQRVRRINEEMKIAIGDCKEDVQIKVDAQYVMANATYLAGAKL